MLGFKFFFCIIQISTITIVFLFCVFIVFVLGFCIAFTLCVFLFGFFITFNIWYVILEDL